MVYLKCKIRFLYGFLTWKLFLWQRSGNMSGFFTKNSMVASLFNNTTSANYGIYNSLSEYNNIRSGNYYKLTKKYYSGDIDTGEVNSKRVNRTEYDYKNGDYKINLLEKEENKVSSSTSTSKTEAEAIANVQKGSKNMKAVAEDLYTKGKDSLFKEDDYDKNEVYEAVSSFVKGYNDLVTTAGKTDSKTIANSVDSMTNITKANEKALAEIGIKITDDNKLTIDPVAFKNANTDNVRTIFNGNGSYGYQVGVSATMIDFAAQNEALKANTYTGFGTFSYNYNSGSMFNYGL